MDIVRIQDILLLSGMIFLSITILFCLIIVLLGPRFTDRVLGINVIGVKTIILILMLAVYKGKSYLIDIALVYSTISFLSVVVLSKIFLNHYIKNEELKNK